LITGFTMSDNNGQHRCECGRSFHEKWKLAQHWWKCPVHNSTTSNKSSNDRYTADQKPSTSKNNSFAGIGGIPAGFIQRDLSIPSTKRGLINGETIRYLQETLGVSMSLIQENESDSESARPLQISGPPDNVGNAYRTIESILNGETFLMHVPADKTGLFFGRSGEVIKQICAKSGANVELSRDPLPNASEKIFVINGLVGQVLRAKELIGVKLGEIILNIPVSPLPGSNSSAFQTDTNPNGTRQQNDNHSNVQQNDIIQGSTSQQPQAQTVPANTAPATSGVSAVPIISQSQQQSGFPVPYTRAEWREYYRKKGMFDEAALFE
jgi:hypothetical protein